jgi:hypothetical protein
VIGTEWSRVFRILDDVQEQGRSAVFSCIISYNASSAVEKDRCETVRMSGEVPQ